MKKTLFYKFIPSQAQQEACMARNLPWQVRRRVVEIRDVNDGTDAAAAAAGARGIRRVLSREEVVMGGIVVPFAEAFKHVFQHWTLGMIKRAAVKGENVDVVIWDVTNRFRPKRYSNGVHIQVLANQDYGVWCMDLFSELGLGVYDLIWLAWDPLRSAFLLRLIHKALPPTSAAAYPTNQIN
nr:hypothetical protein A4A49_59639 [Ipomoea trifida]GME06236.1 hypothetical protein A4A49_59639 [Ipomoea batatas]